MKNETKTNIQTECLYIQDEEEAVKALKEGKQVMRYEFGDSMFPILKNGEYARLIPKSQFRPIKQGDAVFCKMTDEQGNSWYLTHIVWMVSNSFYLIGSTGGHLNGWVHKSQVFAIALPTNKIVEKEKEDEFEK